MPRRDVLRDAFTPISFVFPDYGRTKIFFLLFVRICWLKESSFLWARATFIKLKTRTTIYEEPRKKNNIENCSYSAIKLAHFP